MRVVRVVDGIMVRVLTYYEFSRFQVDAKIIVRAGRSHERLRTCRLSERSELSHTSQPRGDDKAITSWSFRREGLRTLCPAKREPLDSVVCGRGALNRLRYGMIDLKEFGCFSSLCWNTIRLAERRGFDLMFHRRFRIR